MPPVFHYKSGPYPSLLSLSDFPTGFAFLAASLKQAGHEVIGLNPNNILGYPSAKLMLQDVLTKKINEAQPALIGLGGLCTDYSFLRDAIAIARANSTAPIVLGGQIVTNDAEFIFNDLKPDFAIKGEADEAIVELATALESKGRLEPFIAQAIAPSLDKLPFPDYEPFGVQDMMDNHSLDTRLLYRYPRPYPRPFNIVASRSCPFNCTFCVHQRRTMPYRARSMANIMAEIKDTYLRYKFNILIILDELFAVNKKRMTEFCDGIMEGKRQYGWDFDWMFQTHASARLDLSALQMAKAAGCFFFSYGLESASPSVLKSMNKKIKVEQVIEAITLARQAKVGFGANLIFGDPAETKESWAESLSFWLRHGQDTFIFLAMLNPYPGSKIFETNPTLSKDKRKFYEHIDEGVVNMTSIPDEDFAKLIEETGYLEKAWLFVKNALNPRVEREDGKILKVFATCPYCGEESMYRERILKQNEPFMLGTGCTRCHRRVKVRL